MPYVSEEQRRIVTMAYPSEAVVNLCELYTTVEVGADIGALSRARLPVLVFANPNDPVVSAKQKRASIVLLGPPASGEPVSRDSSLRYHRHLPSVSPSCSCLLRIQMTRW